MRASGGVSPAVRAVLVTAAASLMMVLVAWATLIGPDEVFTGAGTTERTFTTPTERTCIPAPTPSSDGTVETPDNPDDLPVCEAPDDSLNQARDLVQQADPPLWVKVVVWTIELLLVAAMLALAVFAVLRARELVQRRTRFGGERPAGGFAVLDEPDRVAAAITEDAAEQDQLLRDGEPRNAIVAAWQRFEVQGASAGVPRESWETSSEYALRILDVVQAHEPSVLRLAGIYREARFSEHPITEEHRAAALVALAAIRSSLAART